MKIKDLPHEERPREKLRRFGPSNLLNHELLAIILRVGNRKMDVMEISRRVLGQYANAELLADYDVNLLKKTFGLTFVQACQISALMELAKRLYGSNQDIPLRSPEEVYAYVRDMAFLKQEYLRGLYLNTRNQLIHDKLISIGTINASLGHPREILAPAIDVRAASFILVHNHPSGDPTPSREDVLFTRQIFEASRIVSIDLLDHIVIGKKRFYSMREKKPEIWKIVN